MALGYFSCWGKPTGRLEDILLDCLLLLSLLLLSSLTVFAAKTLGFSLSLGSGAKDFSTKLFAQPKREVNKIAKLRKIIERIYRSNTENHITRANT